MKKAVFSLFLLFLATSLNAQKILVGDMNNDNELDIKDVTELVNVITGKSEKSYISPVEVFIRENKLTGKFKVDGVEKSYIDGEYDPYNGHEFVDLGLSVKWATCNVGANSPAEYGGYFSWAETHAKSSYEWTDYSYCNGTFRSMNKYCSSGNYGAVDSLKIMELKDDVAHTLWNGEWRIPTYEEQLELSSKCKWEWTNNYNNTNVAGYIVTSRVTGYTDKSIFLPAAGNIRSTTVNRASTYGYYWSSSLYTSQPNGAYIIYFSSLNLDWDLGYRNYGMSVRAVCK